MCVSEEQSSAGVKKRGGVETTAGQQQEQQPDAPMKIPDNVLTDKRPRHWLLKRKEDWRTLGFVFLYFFVSYAVWVYEARLPVLLRVVLFLAASHFSFVGAVATHNTMHAAVFHSRILNKVFQCLLTLTYGHPVSSYVPGHNLSHHKYTQTPRDIMRTTKARWRWHLLNGLFFQQTVAVDVLRSDFRYMLLQRRLKRPIYPQALTELAVLLAVTVAQISLDARKFFFYVYLPHTFGQWGIVSMNILQHDGCEVAERVGGTSKGMNCEINSSRNFTGRLLNYLCLNNGYHSVHHMKPHMHWADLPEAHRTYVQPRIHKNLCHDNMATYMWRTFVYPGKRLWYNGTPYRVEEDPAGEEVDWIIYPRGDNWRPPGLGLYKKPAEEVMVPQ